MSMAMRSTTMASRIPDILGRHEQDLLQEWVRLQLDAATMRRDLLREDELREQSRRFLTLLRSSLQNGGADGDVEGAGWKEMRDMLGDLSRRRARQGFSPSETAMFVLSLKQPLFGRLRHELEG